MNNLINKIEQNRKIILWAELGALLHDIGKMSKKWMEYRQKWKKNEDGWNYWNDPHDHDFINNYDKLMPDEIFKALENNLNKTGGLGVFQNYFDKKNSEGYTLLKAINEHTKDDKSSDPNKKIEKFYKFLKAADGKDAAIDRNNPLYTSEQIVDVYDSDVYGREDTETKVTIEKLDGLDGLDEKREKLYKELEELLPEYINKIENDALKDYKDYECRYYDEKDKSNNNVNTILRKYFDDKVFSDTTRPQNDTSLWEHSYAVACIQKVILLHKIIYGENLDSFNKVRFGIFGVGWDGIAFISSGHKIGDVMARKRQIDEYKKKIRKIFEFEYLLGNKIYDDDNGIYFLIPALTHKEIENTDFNGYKAYGELLQDIQEIICNLKTDGNIHFDIFPHFHFIKETKYITKIVECITELNKKSKYLFQNNSYGEKYFEHIKNEWEKKGEDKTVCPICRVRPVEKEKGNKNENKKICKICKKQRIKIDDTLKKRQTPFISEIIKGNNKDSKCNRAALITVKFGLKDWLNGKMVRSLFITEAKGLEKELEDLGNTRDFEHDEKEARKWLETNYGNLISSGYDYQRIKNEVDLCFDYDDEKDTSKRKYAENIVFLYDRRVKDGKFNRNPQGLKKQWETFRDNAREEHNLTDINGVLENIVCSKTPTPSTILDVWNTTQKFIYKLINPDTEKLNESLLIKPKDNKDKIFEEISRLKFNAKKPEGIEIREICEIEMDNEKTEIIWTTLEEGLILGRYSEKEINNLKNKKVSVRIKGSEFTNYQDTITLKILAGERYYP